MKTSEDKKIQIKKTLKETRERRIHQSCRVYELKIDESHLNKKERNQLQMFFVEAKWLYNHILNQEDLFTFDYKTTCIQKMNKDGKIDDITLQYLPAKSRQDVVKLLQQNIKNLAASKKKGYKVGKLKHKSNYNSIELSQYGKSCTHYIAGKNHFKITNIKRPLKVHGLEQLSEDMEFANAKLQKKPSGYYIKLTTYCYPKGEVNNEYLNNVGLDYGIKTNITTSEGKQYNVTIPETERLKRLQRKLHRRTQKGSKNRYKLRILIQKEYEKIINRKKDRTNKICHDLLSNHHFVVMQDENLRGWQKGRYGKQVQHSCMGSIEAKLKRSKQVIVISRWEPSTKQCYVCGTKITIGLEERIFSCPMCGLTEDRDIKAAKTILKMGLMQIGMECTESKPVEKTASVGNFVASKQSSLNQEASILNLRYR